MLCTLCAHMPLLSALQGSGGLIRGLQQQQQLYVKVWNGWLEARSLRPYVGVLCFCRMCCLLGWLHMLCRSCLSMCDTAA